MMIDVQILLPLVVPGLAFLIWHLRTRRRFTTGRLLAIVGFSAYLLLVIKYTIFPLRFDSEYIELYRRQSRFVDGIRLVPLKDLSREYLMSIQGWGNVVLGVPFGFVYPFVMPVIGWRAIMRYGVLFAATIEAAQLSISLIYGFPYRVIDVNDILLNFSGVLGGYALLQALALLYRAALSQSPRGAKVREESVWGYIESVMFRSIHHARER